MKAKLKTRLIETSVLCLLILGGVSLPVQAASESTWRFKVYLDDREIGYHQVSLRDKGEQQKVAVNAYFKVKFLFFTAFQYRHRNYETWKNGCLHHLESDTDQNGEKFFIRARSDESSLRIETQLGESSLQGCVRSFAYWDPSLLDGSNLLNTQSGDYETVELTDMGSGTMAYQGREQVMKQYRLKVQDSHIDLYYDDNNDWVGLKTETEGGKLLSYVSEKLLSEAPETGLQASSTISVIQ